MCTQIIGRDLTALYYGRLRRDQERLIEILIGNPSWNPNGSAWRRKTIYHMGKSTLQCPADRERGRVGVSTAVRQTENRSICELSATLNAAGH